ncbi:MAG: hypothetical protein E6I81_03525 [Chloroflexi bacterium]|nr:MAG: hypothetical protein AUI15_28700 [Actinobacteria bacterium 13_2_20CM_2_66_6]TMC80810.1 MAG: hypothetical protein E6J08_09180 [Chloroflexota bacterium]TMD36396.1 MAG: hypothetical protein E6I89_11730 [Chloroflexota bacterium]TMD73698.1 MAG: hypothetical protein E6I81_03525 [Chloroflexota bacterium]
MDHYSAEKWMLERHRDMIRTAERQARLGPETDLTLRSWSAACLRSLADRLDGAARLDPSGNLSPHLRLVTRRRIG